MILAPKSRWKRRSEQLEVGLALGRVWQTGAEDEAPNWEPPDPNKEGYSGVFICSCQTVPYEGSGEKSVITNVM